MKTPAPKLAPIPKKASRRGRLADRDQVVAATDGRCSYVAPDGHQCSSHSFIEIDHAMPWALGGDSRRENLRPVCRMHNAWLAERSFGRRPAEAYSKAEAAASQ